MKAWISLGSNLGSGCDNLVRALECIGRDRAIEVTAVSACYRSEPWGETNQPDFTNAVACLETELSPIELLDRLLSVEIQLGRTRTDRRWGPRTIDLDLLSCDEVVLHSPTLILPHPRMHLRRFVLEPLLELDPGFEIPGIGSAASCAAVLEGQKVSILGALKHVAPPSANAGTIV